MNVNRRARFTAVLYLSIIPFSVFGILYVPSVLVVPGDPATTASNIMASEALFRGGIVSHLIGQVIFVFLALVLHRLLWPVNRGHAVLMVVLALLGVSIAFLNEINHLAVLTLLSGAGYLASIDTDLLHAQAMMFLGLRSDGILLAQVFWGLWLLPLGYLILRSGFIPGVFGVLMMIACFGYVFDVVVTILFPDTGMTVSHFTFIGELLLPLWLLFKGVNVDRWESLALEARVE